MDSFYKKSLAINELAFSLASEVCKGDINCIYRKLMSGKMDEKSLGFWIWDIPDHVEIYSPRFRHTLGFNDENDFPDNPDSWMKAIEKTSLDLALQNYESHVQTGGIVAYDQKVVYNKKNGGKVTLICRGKIVLWQDGQPKVMVGIHLPPDSI